MLVREIMTKDLKGIDRNASIRAAAQKMKSLDVGFLPVLDGNHPVGVLTDRDITIRAVAEGMTPDETPVDEIMTREIDTIHETENISNAAELMERDQIRRLLVLDEEDSLVGVLSLGDLAVHSGQMEMCGEVLERVSEPAHPRV